MKKIYIITGGTMVHVTPHFSLCAPAYGKVGDKLSEELFSNIVGSGLNKDYSVHVLPTKMADGNYNDDHSNYHDYKLIYHNAGLKYLETNDDLSQLVDYLIAQPDTRCIVMAAAVCDFKPDMLEVNNYGKNESVSLRFGKEQKRLDSSKETILHLDTAEKILSKIRKDRKDIFLVSFKTTSGVGRDETYRRGLESLKKNSSNLVFANDIKDRINMIVTPEEYPYQEQTRAEALKTLSDMIVSRIQLTFNRTSIIDGDKADIKELFEGNNIPQNFIEVMEYLILNDAFKPFRGKTSGHFGCKVEGKEYDRIASVRKVDHNNMFEEGMAKIFRKNGNITAMGGKPSVGEHTQEMIYNQLGDIAHSIVHFHSPRKVDSKRPPFIIRSQKDFECGSNECGINTSAGIENSEMNGIYAVHLENHGPNIAFHKDVDSGTIISFIERYWDLSDKEGGLIKEIKQNPEQQKMF